MRRIIPKREWKILDFEVFENGPKTDELYPPKIVRRRELLLYAQVHLAEISWARKFKDLESERYHTHAYCRIMLKYYEQDVRKLRIYKGYNYKCVFCERKRGWG